MPCFKDGVVKYSECWAINVLCIGGTITKVSRRRPIVKCSMHLYGKLDKSGLFVTGSSNDSHSVIYRPSQKLQCF